MTSDSPQLPPRLYAIVARDAPVAVVFRRGPSKWWHIMKWDLANDAIEHGAWIKASLYPRSSGLSPDGRLLCYFAIQSAEESIPAWRQCSAVSKTPWLTALCAWRSMSTYGIQGYFHGNDHLGLSGVESMTPFHGEFPGRVVNSIPWDQSGIFTNEVATGWKSSKGLRVRIADEFRTLLARCDRSCKAALEKRCRVSGQTLILMYLGTRFVDRAVEGRLIAYTIETADGTIHDLANVAWADFDHAGRLLIATDDGVLQVRDPAQGPAAVVWQYDLRDLKPDPQPSPEWARQW